MTTFTHLDEALQWWESVDRRLHNVKNLIDLATPDRTTEKEDQEAVLDGADALLDDAIQIHQDCRKFMRLAKEEAE